VQIEQWWPQLSPAIQEWLIANNGDSLPASVRDAITAAGGSVPASQLTDEQTDWIEAVANGETPASSG